MSGRPMVLAYHGVADVSLGRDPHHLMVPASRVRSQLESLLARSYTFVTVSDFAARLARGERLDGMCALSFDDGSEDGATAVPSLLAELGVPATLYVCPGLLGRPHPFLAEDAGVRLMTREQLGEVAGLPFVEIGSHTTLHADLGQATAAEAYREMAASKEALEDLIQRPVETFAYPFCRYSSACPPAAARAGYSSAVTCGPLGGLRPYELRREAISRLDGRLAFSLKSRGAYYGLWLSPPARVARRAMRPFRHGGLARRRD